MDKVRVYKGIDPNDGALSLFAIKGKRVAPAIYHPYSKMLSRETFGSFESWGSTPCPEDKAVLESLDDFELIWEE